MALSVEACVVEGGVLSLGFCPKPQPVPVAPEPNREPGAVCCEALGVAELPNMPPEPEEPEEPVVFWFAVFPNRLPVVPAAFPKAGPPLAG